MLQTEFKHVPSLRLIARLWRGVSIHLRHDTFHTFVDIDWMFLISYSLPILVWVAFNPDTSDAWDLHQTVGTTIYLRLWFRPKHSSPSCKAVIDCDKVLGSTIWKNRKQSKETAIYNPNTTCIHCRSLFTYFAPLSSPIAQNAGMRPIFRFQISFISRSIWVHLLYGCFQPACVLARKFMLIGWR